MAGLARTESRQPGRKEGHGECEGTWHQNPVPSFCWLPQQGHIHVLPRTGQHLTAPPAVGGASSRAIFLLILFARVQSSQLEWISQDRGSPRPSLWPLYPPKDDNQRQRHTMPAQKEAGRQGGGRSPAQPSHPSIVYLGLYVRLSGLSPSLADLHLAL